MLIKSFSLGQLGTNCYIVTDEKTLCSAVIDPGDEAAVILDYIEENRLKVEHIFITHGHFDHTGAVLEVAEDTGADIWINEKELCQDARGDMDFCFCPQGVAVMTYSDGDRILCGGLTFEIIDTPGHSRGSVTIKCENALFTGDTLFRDSCGRTDLPGGSMRTLLASLKKIAELPGDFEVYPGHMEATSLSREREFNHYIKFAYNMKK